MDGCMDIQATLKVTVAILNARITRHTSAKSTLLILREMVTT